jgi:hypothetical protein
MHKVCPFMSREGGDEPEFCIEQECAVWEREEGRCGFAVVARFARKMLLKDGHGGPPDTWR